MLDDFFSAEVAVRLSKKSEVITKLNSLYFQHLKSHIRLILKRRTQIFSWTGLSSARVIRKNVLTLGLI
jgi:hypothetical protein